MRKMNYLRSLALAVLALTTLGMTAASVDANQAKGLAVKFLNGQPGTRFMASAANVKLAYTEQSKVDAKLADFYVFNRDGGGGFVIVAGDDRAEEILGYGDGTLDMDNIPSNLRWWLSNYSEQIEYLHANPRLEVVTPSKLLAGRLNATTISTQLMTCTWDQEAPYYNQCPTYNGSRCMTGCVATAMAQVMYYWKYPATLPALSSYKTYSYNFTVSALSGATLDWDNMLDDYSSVSYNTTQATAVATLMRYCGQAVEMDYTPDGSGAETEDQLAAIKTFGYDSGASIALRNDYTATAWNELMQAELAAGRPIMYGGYTSSNYANGHAFVVDGYNSSTSKYHVNFGWSGDGNGFYAMDAFSTSGYTFKYYQDAIIGVYPPGQGGITTVAPVLADAQNVGTTSFKAVWTDETESENVTDYTLYVQSYDPNCETLLSETFAGVTATSDGTSNIGSSLDSYCDNAGWTGTYVYQGAGGCLKLGSSKYAGTLTTPSLDMSTSGGTITVKFNAKYYSSDASSVVVSCGSVSETVELTATAADYSVVLSGVNAAAGQTVTFAGTAQKKRFYIDNVEIMTGNAATLRASETGDANSRVITGITAKNYTVTGLNEGGSYRFYVEANYTDGSKKQSNTETVTLDGTLAPTPELIADPETLTMTANVGETATATFGILGTDLTGNVTLTLNDANGVFTISPTSISAADAQQGASVTVNYTPLATGNHSATITMNSEDAQAVTVTVNGTATLTTTAPVMAAATNVGTTSFTATWTDATSPANVRDYTLYVNKVGAVGDALLNETFAGVNVTKDGTVDRGSTMDTYCDNSGWTGYAAYEAMSGGFKLGSGSKLGYITTPALAENNGTLVVAFNANSYGSDASTVVVSCGDVSETVTLADVATDYTITLAGVPTAAGQQVKFSCEATGKRVYIHSVAIYNGGAATLRASETGDANSRVITGITDKTYTVQGLTAGATYDFHVVANYTDGSNAASNVEQVTLADAVVPELIVDPETLSLTANVGETVTTTFDVLGANLTDDVTVTLTDESGMFTVAPATISVADAQEGATVTVTYAPTAAGTHTAVIAITSDGAEDVTVTVTGTAAMPLGALVMQPADEEYVTSTSFRADWTDETATQYVQDFTLYVNIKADEPTPSGLLLNETFYSEEVPSSDSNTDIGAAGTLDDECDNAGWTGYAVYLAGGGGMKLGAGSKIGTLTTPALDLSGSNGVITVKFNAKSYGSDASSVIVSCGEVADTVVLTEEAADYTVVLTGVPAMADQNVTLSGIANKKRFYLYSVQVYSGDASEATLKAVNETGDENSRVITGITDKYYVVENLTAGATYEYYVVANYLGGTTVTSNVETVTLPEEADHGYTMGDVNHDGVVGIADVTALIDHILDSTNETCSICADLDGNGIIGIADVTTLIDMILSK